MDPVVRRKIPASLRSLLTDIAPREDHHFTDWQQTDPESVSNDGIVLPKRGTSETLLAPATGKEREPTDGNVATSFRPCGLCLSKPSCYTCPRCNVPYCGLVCYRSPGHSACSEEFYKESVFQELKSQGVTDEEGKSKMQEILLRLRQNAEGEGGMTNLLRNLHEETGTSVTQQDAEALELLSRLAEIQSAGDEGSQEAHEILTKLQDIEEAGNAIDECDEEEAELTEKLAGLDIDSLSEEELWSLLSAQEKEKFEALVKGGGIGGLVELWSPWWENHEKDTKAFIEELKSENDEEIHDENETKDGQIKAGVEKMKVNTSKVKFALGTKQKSIKKDKSVKKSNSIPAISAKIPPLHTLSSSPSPLVQYNLINVLYGYTFSLCLFNGDISEQEMLLEFCQVLLGVSEVLGEGRVFTSIPEALEAGVTAVSTSRHFNCEDPWVSLRAVKAVAHVLSGESREDIVGYSLSALSQLRLALNKAKASVPKTDEQVRRMYFQAGKKCEFLQSWLIENPAAVRSLAGQVWMDYERREGERMKLEGEKKDVEMRVKRSRGDAVLIEELV